MLDLGEASVVSIQTTQKALFRSQTTPKTHGPCNGLGLFQAFLDGPMRVGVRTELNFLIGRLLLARQIQSTSVGMQDTDFSILHGNEILGESIEGGRFTRNKGAIVANANDQGRPVAGHNQLVGRVGAHDAESPGSVAAREGLFRGLFDRAALVLLVVMTNQFGNDFGIGLAREFVTLGLEFATEFVGIVERPVVHQGDASRGIRVRVGVLVRLSTVRRPTRVGNANGMTDRRLGVRPHQLDRIGLVSVTGVLCNGLKESKCVSVCFVC